MIIRTQKPVYFGHVTLMDDELEKQLFLTKLKITEEGKENNKVDEQLQRDH